MTALRAPRAPRLVGALLAACVLLLAACTAMPTSGPVQQGDGRVDEPSGIDVLAEGPRPDAAPVEIVERFLVAGSAGFRDNFVVARQYLAGEARSEWEPLAGVVVSGALELTEISAAQVQVDVPVVARVDRDGRYSEAPAGAETALTYVLVQDDDGQWRIVDAPDGLVVPVDDFEVFFRQTALYFLSPDETFLVPELRWLPARNLPTYVASALLAGPSPWLRDAVHTAVPEGVQLKPEAVDVDDDGVAHVGLYSARAADVLDADRPLLLAQLERSLLELSGVGGVEVSVGSVSLEGAATLSQGTPAGTALELLQDGALVQLGQDGVVPVEGVSLEGVADPRHPARDESGDVRVVLSGTSRLVTVPTETEPSTLLYAGTALSPPSVDRFGFAWTADADAGVVAARAGSEPVHVGADWLEGRTVRALRVARDGVRVAVVSQGEDGVAVELAAVVRDRRGVPQGFGEPVRVGTPLADATAVVWVDEATLGVLGGEAGENRVHLVPLAGETTALPDVPGLVSLSGGRTPYVATSDGSLLKLVGSSWVRVPDVTGASDPAFAG
ncbi:LpqB family beta-propeller domain-containing protein [Cellulomonas fimi]|uniref:Lipoprotein LpqB, beta-propeller domain-like protein n=1 Tax=Cellulomonas fimi (strain ATCC 484 / DSM 20113 / JCM 1341 / CCUG 24087 / LMG 16345 / NBRC 15513 / NCIMB 8980 / NCTC 7547 / NRS-133) TaxID=590998 RepID=F4H4C1_CELFA|nr:LpqB family beta-propeller domain-containing protein [Cellulomonas fimi]AEE46597.1 Lipoprotein LpqB, beta-propeller domain-like protein [Cellulomonas fimi ATCC 484]VEH33621.1 lipoprotein LpqB [Cellulomonas fimi]